MKLTATTLSLAACLLSVASAADGIREAYQLCYCKGTDGQPDNGRTERACTNTKTYTVITAGFKDTSVVPTYSDYKVRWTGQSVAMCMNPPYWKRDTKNELGLKIRETKSCGYDPQKNNFNEAYECATIAWVEGEIFPE